MKYEPVPATTVEKEDLTQEEEGSSQFYNETTVNKEDSISYSETAQSNKSPKAGSSFDKQKEAALFSKMQKLDGLLDTGIYIWYRVWIWITLVALIYNFTVMVIEMDYYVTLEFIDHILVIVASVLVILAVRRKSSKEAKYAILIYLVGMITHSDKVMEKAKYKAMENRLTNNGRFALILFSLFLWFLLT